MYIMQSNLASNSRYYQVITGYITDLELYDSYQNFIQARTLANRPDFNVSSIGHLDKVFNENSYMKAILARREDNSPIPNIEQYFCFKLGDKVIEGVFCRAFFNIGDYVEVVVDQIEGESYFAYALRRPVDHYLWLHPYATMGTELAKRKKKKYLSLIPIIIFSSFGITGAFFFVYMLILAYSYKNVALLFGAAVGLLFFLPVHFYYSSFKQLESGSPVADKIFATLGYVNPKNFAIERECDFFIDKFNFLYEQYKANYSGSLTDEEELYEEFTDYYRSQQSDNDTEDEILLKRFLSDEPPGKKWVYIYRTATVIPSYITVIHTEDNNDKVES